MSPSKRSLTAKKAWDTIRKKKKHVRSQQAGRKAWQDTIIPSEYGYIDELAKTQRIRKKNIFHHDGIPDLMIITENGKMRFIEIKPKKGAMERKMLNPKQVETIKELLKHDYVEEVNLVKYEKQEGKIVYDPPIKLTKSNLKEYSYKGH